MDVVMDVVTDQEFVDKIVKQINADEVNELRPISCNVSEINLVNVKSHALWSILNHDKPDNNYQTIDELEDAIKELKEIKYFYKLIEEMTYVGEIKELVKDLFFDNIASNNDNLAEELYMYDLIEYIDYLKEEQKKREIEEVETV